MKTTKEKYRYALGLKWLAPWYDRIVQILVNEEKFRNHIIQAANIKPNHKIIDLGCGTASLIIKIKQKYPEAEVIGLDGDSEILSIAKKKIDNLKLGIVLEEGMIYQLPYPDNSFDRVFTTLALHHLNLPDKVKALREMFRILRPMGEIHVADFDQPDSKDGSFIGFLKNLHHHNTGGAGSSLEQLLNETGFISVKNLGNFKTIAGNINCFGAGKSII